MTSDQAAQILQELRMIRQLKLLELKDRGYTQAQIAEMLGVSQPTVSRMFPKRAAAKEEKIDG